MDWLADLALKRLNAHADAQALTTKADALWEGLRQMLQAAYSLYNVSFPPVANGEGVWYAGAAAKVPVVCGRCHTDAANHQAAEIARVTISFNSPVITASYSDGRPPLLITMGRDEKGYVAALHDGTPVSMDRAAEIILRPVLFPDYPERTAK